MSHDDFYEVLDSFDTCMLLTFTSDGSPHARPMALAGREGSAVWFISGRDSVKVDEVDGDRNTVVTVQDSRRWAAATGTATVVDDRARIEQLWSTPMQAWFPDGPEDTDVVAIRVELTDGEYWDVSGGRLLRFAAGIARSVVTGDSIDDDEEGDHGRHRL